MSKVKCLGVMVILASFVVGVFIFGTPMLVERAMEKNPELIFGVIKKHPAKFVEVLKDAAKVAQEGAAQDRRRKEEQEIENSFENPLKAAIRSDENIRGNPNAPITLIEYSDFECPFCSRALTVVEALMKKYGNNLRFIYKHLPLSFHPQAMLAAQYHEAIRLQSGKKAWSFHDELLRSTPKVKLGGKYFLSVAKKLKVNLAKLKKDVNSAVVRKRIEEDMKEAESFGFQGTPGFILNGIPVKGALPVSYFDGIIEKLKEKGKLNI